MAVRRPVRILLTGFAPFGGSRVNPSWEAVRRLRRARIPGVRMFVMKLPVQWETAREKMVGTLRRLHPDAVVCVGQSSGRKGVHLEERAVNQRFGKDVRGSRPPSKRIIRTAPTNYGATLPTDRILHVLRSKGIPARRSSHAGRYLCNEVMFAALHEAVYAWQFGSSFRAGFLHVPMLPSQAKGLLRREPTLPLRTSIRAVRLAVVETARSVRGAGRRAEV